MKETKENQLENNLVPCVQCGRKFASDRMSKHLTLCKVEVFDEKDMKNKRASKLTKKNPNNAIVPSDLKIPTKHETPVRVTSKTNESTEIPLLKFPQENESPLKVHNSSQYE